MMLLQKRTNTLVVKDVRTRPVRSALALTVPMTLLAHAMKSDWQTVTENRQIQQSVTLALDFLLILLAPSPFVLLSGVEGAAPPSALSCLRAFVLQC